MAYIVASATEPDAKFETYEEACAWAQFTRRNGIEATIVTSDCAVSLMDVRML